MYTPTQMTRCLQLSPTISYYIRKLLRDNLDHLKSVVAFGAGLQADPLADLNAVLKSLYMEEYEVNAVVVELQDLTARHQLLSNYKGQYRQELEKLEMRIFWLLGYKEDVPTRQGVILVIDDQPDNIRLLSKTLEQHGYEVRSTTSGTMGVVAARSAKPDLILLDIMMPGMNGYEVCQKLKADPQTEDIPVIFISAIDQVSDKVEAFRIGGVDYISKPFHIDEVLARVDHQIQIRQLHAQLEEQNLRFQEELRDRASEKYTLGMAKIALDQMGDYILFIDATGKIIYGNDAAIQCLGYSPEQLSSKTLFELDQNLTSEDWTLLWERLTQWGFITNQATHVMSSAHPLRVSVAFHYFEMHERSYACLVARKVATEIME
jgi:PAS domain S-box-containing protein